MTILNDYTPIQRFRIILTGIGLLTVVAYFLSIRNTVELRRDLSKKQKQLANISDAPQTIAQLESQLEQIDAQLQGSAYDRNALFATISKFCEENELRLIEFSEDQRWEEGQITYINTPLRVAGSYQNILRLMYLLEQQERLGYLSHSKMSMERKNRRRRTEELQAEIHIQFLEINR